MCTAISTKEFFGRNLDLEISFGEGIAVTPRCFPLSFRHKPFLAKHYAIIGTAIISNNYPLYYDAINEKGLGAAGLNFPHYADYKNLGNLASFEIIPYILAKAETVEEAKELLRDATISKEAFAQNMPPSPLHWLIGDEASSFVVEETINGLEIHDNPVGVLTNSPTFSYQLFALNNYMGLSAKEGENRFSGRLRLDVYSRGMGAIGLPGDLSSQSRFIKASFTKMNYVYDKKETLSDFMHILSSVEQQRGCAEVKPGQYEITRYSSAGERRTGTYYYRTYTNSRIRGVKLQNENLSSSELIFYPFKYTEDIAFEN